MKYRILNDEELSHLNEQLKQFLIINGIYGDEWKRLNEEEPQKAVGLIELFSDHVLQIVYEKTTFLEKQTPDACFVFHCKPQTLELIAIQKKNSDDPAIDLSSTQGIHSALTQSGGDLTFFRIEKPYSKEREQEIHLMFMDGCIKSSEVFWNQLGKVIS